MKRIHFFNFLLLTLIIFSCSKKDENTNPIVDYDGFNTDLLEAAIEAARQDGGVKCLIINKGGDTIVEEYFNDHPDSVYHVRSVTKSFMSALYGIAIDQGHLNINETIGDYLSVDYTLSPEVANITIENLLKMSGGFEWEEFVDFTTYWNPWALSDNLVQHALNATIINPQGEVFTYTTAGSHILSAIFEKATGRSLLDFAEEYLFDPLDMSDNIIWYTDFQEVVYGGVMLNVTPGDMLKLGLLYLNNGVYNGTRIISQEWIEASHTPHLNTNLPYLGAQYGYQWWIDSYQSQHFYFANGYGGQFIFVFPEYELVVVGRSDYNLVANRTASQQWVATSNIIVNRVFGALN